MGESGMGARSRWLGFVLVLTGATFWGIGGTVAQRLFQEDGVEVGWLVSVRLLLAGMVMILLALMTKNRANVFHIWKKPRAVVQLVLFALLGMLAVQYTYMASISYGNAAVATLLQYLAPVFILIFLVFTRQSRLKIQEVAAVTLTLTGTLFLLTDGSLKALSVPIPAVIWGVLSGISLAFYTLYAGSLLKKWGSLNVIGWAMIIGGAVLAIIHPPWSVNTDSWTLETYVFLGFVILFGTMFAFWFYLESLRYLKPQDTSLLGSVEPLSAVAASVLWLNVPFGIYQLIGTALILTMVLFLSLFKDQPATAEVAVLGE